MRSLSFPPLQKVLDEKFGGQGQQRQHCRQLAERVLLRAKEDDVRNNGIFAEAKNLKLVDTRSNFAPDKLKNTIEVRLPSPPTLVPACLLNHQL